MSQNAAPQFRFERTRGKKPRRVRSGLTVGEAHSIFGQQRWQSEAVVHCYDEGTCTSQIDTAVGVSI